MKTPDQQELDMILKSSKADIAVMLVFAQRRAVETESKLRAELTALKAELTGRDKVFHLLELMAGESQLGLRVTK